MCKFVSVLFLIAAPCLFSQKTKADNLNVYVTPASSLFASHVLNFHHLDLANLRAVFIEPGGERGKWQTLKNGKGKTVDINRYGEFEGATDVILAWQQVIDATHWLAAYDWEWIGGSSSHSQIIQVFEIRGDRVFVTQQIEADTHHGGKATGATLSKEKKTLIVKAVELDSPKGRCCPTYINVVAFRWTGSRFQQVSSHQVPIPSYGE
jgi:hypothetical protein